MQPSERVYMTLETFPILHPDIHLEIRLEDVGKLHIHEEIIPAILCNLTEEIRADGHFKHPVIVDSKTLVVLDGMHRVAAAEGLGCRFIPVCLVEYENPNILVGCWWRIVNHSSNLERLLDSIRELGFILKDCERKIAHELVNERKVTTSILSQSKCFVAYGSQNGVKEIYDAIKRIELKLQSKSYSIEYYTESDAEEKVSLGKALSTLAVPKVSKREVVTAALKGEVFAHKTSRHTIPVRPLFVNVPLNWLRGGFSLKEANQIFIEHLSKRRVRHLPSGQVLDRRYEEELYVFE